MYYLAPKPLTRATAERGQEWEESQEQGEEVNYLISEAKRFIESPAIQATSAGLTLYAVC